jgi:CubicO group peptidase (beta-lactamase class C family)
LTARPASWPRAFGVAFLLAATTVGCSDRTDTQAQPPALVDVVHDFADRTGGAIAVAVVAAEGEPQLLHAGSASSDDASSVTDATVFRVASITKMYLAALALLLVEDGRLALDAPLRSLFDEAGVWGAVTVRQLLSHTSGLPRSGPNVDPSTWRTPADIAWHPICAPGACRNYADENYVVIGMIIERVTGKPLERMLRDRIVTPLGLRRTFLEPAEQPTAPVAQHPVRPVWKPLSGIVTNAEELARFGQALFDGTLVNAASLRAMLDFDATADIPCAEDCSMPLPYGLGVEQYPDGGNCTAWGHSGSTGSYLAVVPARHETIAVVTNVEPWPAGFGQTIIPAVTRGACP